jgi:peptidoglycan/LPS O-acetylase OafA/YrhL
MSVRCGRSPLQRLQVFQVKMGHIVNPAILTCTGSLLHDEGSSGANMTQTIVLSAPIAINAHQGLTDRDDILPAYPWFDWLRFILASVVVLDHGGFKFLPFMTGGLAVTVFFALSGWLIGGILLRTDPKDLPRFFFNRATRIWIPYAIAILLLYGVAALKEGVGYFWFKYLLLDVTFTHQLYTLFPVALFEMPMDGSGNQFWSIAVEEQFYLVAPLIILFAPWGKTLRAWLPIAALALALGWNAASIALGVSAAILQRDFKIADRPFVRLCAVSAAAICIAAISFGAANRIFGPIFAAALVIATAIPGRRSSLAMIAGGVSYPLYLNHWFSTFIIHFVQKRWLDFGHSAFLVSYYLFAVLMTLAMYWCVDRQIHNRRNNWYSSSLGRRLAVIAYGLVAIGIVSGAAMELYGPHATVPAGYKANSG